MTTASVPAPGLGLGKARMVGLASALALAAIHLIEMPEDFEEMPYLGVLFGIGGVLLVAAAAGLIRRSSRRVAWATGSLVAVGMFVGYCLSRTVGLPGMDPEPWGEPLGVLSLVLEVVFVAAAAAAFVAHSRSREDTRTGITART
jgi:drug/metabolite transporter (DMT)-like permease